MDMAGKTILITGSTDGVGRYVAKQLAAKGADVLIHGRDAARAQTLIEEIVREGAAGDRFYAFDKKTGELVWASSPGDRPKDNEAGTWSKVVTASGAPRETSTLPALSRAALKKAYVCPGAPVKIAVVSIVFESHTANGPPLSET